MFLKKEYIFHEHLGVCQVTDIEKLPTDKKEFATYYALKSVNENKTAYLPTENHKVLLRPLVSVEEAKKVMAASEEINPLQRQEAEFVLSREA